LPSHTLPEHTSPLPAGQLPCPFAGVPRTGTHVPGAFGSAQLSQTPVHAVSQQMPLPLVASISAQCPELQSASLVQLPSFTSLHTPGCEPAQKPLCALQLGSWQQTPSWQPRPAPHALGSVASQGRPAAPRGVQLPDAQYAVDAQSVSLEQLVLHASAPHANVPQRRVVELQCPPPSHTPVSVSTPAMHDAVPHAVDDVGQLHWVVSRPLQIFVPHIEPSEPHEGLAPCGAPITGVHTPACAASTWHDSQLPVHAVLQHTPSTQRPEEHCVPAEQARPSASVQLPGVLPLHVPFGQLDEPQQTPSVQNSPAAHCEPLAQGTPSPVFGVHAPPLHQYPGAHAASLLQLVLQPLEPHAYALHDFVVKPHAPAPLHPAGSDSTPLVHCTADEQVVVEPG
jgi:hypothetical protein